MRYLLCLAALLAFGQPPADVAKKEASKKMLRASGTFEVKLTPQTPADPSLGRLTIDKQFAGDLEGSSRGEMLSALTPVKGSAGYVALERVTGKIADRSGSFVLQHTGTMNRGEPEQAVTVVPDSGSGGFEGIAGRMTIRIEGGKHFYEFEYTLPPRP